MPRAAAATQVDPAGPGSGDVHLVAETAEERDDWLEQLAAAATLPARPPHHDAEGRIIPAPPPSFSLLSAADARSLHLSLILLEAHFYRQIAAGT